jgi:hypothetical protein
MPLRLCLLAALCLSVTASCGGDDDDGSDGSPSIDADPGASDANPDQADSGGGGTAGEVPCGPDAVCVSPEGCCVTGGGADDQSCTAQEDCMDGIYQGCDGRDDCSGGDYCCVTETDGIICVGAGDCALALCETPDDCPNDGDLCCMGDNGYGACAADCTPK